MQVQVKLGGELKRYGESGPRDFEPRGPLTVSRAMAEIGIPSDADDVLVIVNDEIVPPSEQGERELQDNDRLALMPQLKGG